MEDTSTSEPIVIPPALLAEVQLAAQEEHRAPSEVLCDALHRYLQERRWQKSFAYGEDGARQLGLTEADVPRLIDEYRKQPPVR